MTGTALSDLWVVTAYFNLAGWSSRLTNYHAFRRALSVPLATIEWHPSGQFALAGDDADLLIQLQGGDLMWQKERLLSIVLAALPAHVRYVAWVDCDVIFANPQWHAHTKQLLQEHVLVQPFSRVVYLGNESTQRLIGGGHFDGDAEGSNSRPSFLHLYEQVGHDIARVDLQRRFEPQPGRGTRYNIMARPAYGHAWAARVDTLRQIGFYQRCVMGGGDLLSAYGLVGHYEEMLANHRSVGWDFYGGGASYREWANEAAGLCRGRLKCGDEIIIHLFHGSLDNRQYRSRIDGLVRFRLDLDRDIEARPGEAWSWKRYAAELNGYFLEYLRRREEDA
jgi:hypothetical protein